MRLIRLIGLLYIGVSGLYLTACLEKDSVVEGDTEAVIEPEESPRDPDSVVCDPFDPDSGEVERTQGVIGQLYYLDATQPQYSSVNDYILNGHHVDEIDIYFNQLFIPTRPFDRGFVTQGGVPITTLEGDTLYEWFALRFEGQIHLGSTDMPGDYQLALLSDDGAIWRADRDGDGVLEDIVDNDGQHGTRLGCTTEAIHLEAGDKIPFQLDYNQGPRFHIALITMWRPWPTTEALVDPLCGRTDNSSWFDSTQDTPEPAEWYIDLLTRGWLPLTTENFSLPESEEENPCNTPAPIMADFKATLVQKTAVTFTWSTDIHADSQIWYRENLTGIESWSVLEPELVTGHTFVVTGLKSNTQYTFRAKSTSVSGRSTESYELTLKTAR